MLIVKFIPIVLIMSCLLPCASASWFNETSAVVFADVEDGGKEFVFALVGICVIYSAAATLIGHFGHRQALFKSGLAGFGVIVFVAIVYILAVSISDYFFAAW